MPAPQKGDPEKRSEEDRKSFERALHDVGESLPDDVPGIEGSDVGSIERHGHAHSEAEALDLGGVEPEQPVDWSDVAARERDEAAAGKEKGARAASRRDAPAKR